MPTQPDQPLKESTTHDLRGEQPFPAPMAVLSLRAATVYRAVDDDDQPILIVSDGVTTIALECGLRGLDEGIISAARQLADAVADYWLSVGAAASGIHRRHAGGVYRVSRATLAQRPVNPAPVSPVWR